MKKLVEIKNISKDFIQNNETIKALKQTNFESYEGEIIGIIGPSGSGKSTFLTILGGLQTPTTGDVIIDGVNFSDLNDVEKSQMRFQKIGFILQASNLIPFLTVKEQMVLYNKISKTKVNEEWLNDLLKSLDVKRLENKYPNELSGGERQRVAIAKALYHDPSVIFADEPTASLDTNRAFEVMELLQKQTKMRKKTTIMVTHDERLLEYCDRIFTIVDGVLSLKQD